MGDGSAVSRAEARERNAAGPYGLSGFAAITASNCSTIERQTSRFPLPSSGTPEISKSTVPGSLFVGPFQASTTPGPRASGRCRSGAEHSEASAPGPMVTKGIQAQPVITGPTCGGSSSTSPSGGSGSRFSSGGSSSHPVQVADPATVAEFQAGFARALRIAPLDADAPAGASIAARTAAPRLDPLTHRLPCEPALRTPRVYKLPSPPPSSWRKRCMPTRAERSRMSARPPGMTGSRAMFVPSARRALKQT